MCVILNREAEDAQYFTLLGMNAKEAVNSEAWLKQVESNVPNSLSLVTQENE